MIARTQLAAAAFALVIAPLAACAPEKHETVDLTSREALRAAETLPHGCSFVETVDTNDNGSFGTTRTPKCMQTRCSDLRPPAPDNYGASVGGYTYVSSKSVSYEDRHDFVGTCDAPEPISCGYLTEVGDACSACVATSCCAPTFFCDHDPNCNAIVECIDNCKDDDACQARCIDNGDEFAASNLRDAVRCMTNSCAAECGGE